MKCRIVRLEVVPPYDADSPFFRRAPVECGGEIIGKIEISQPIFYCARCGVRYEKLPEDAND